MKLIGMLDSPYVRRVAISAKRLGIALEHQSVSVFRHFEQFQQINPVVKAPTLILDDGVVLMDSTLILDYLEAASGQLAASSRHDTPGGYGIPACVADFTLVEVALPELQEGADQSLQHAEGLWRSALGTRCRHRAGPGEHRVPAERDAPGRDRYDRAARLD